MIFEFALMLKDAFVFRRLLFQSRDQAVCPICREDLALLPDLEGEAPVHTSPLRGAGGGDAEALGGLTVVASVAAPPQRAAVAAPKASPRLAASAP